MKWGACIADKIRKKREEEDRVGWNDNKGVGYIDKMSRGRGEWEEGGGG